MKKHDGTPKKYFTLSFDDGITQDKEIIRILKKYNVHCATFFINTGMLGTNQTSIADRHNRPDVTQLRFTEEELRTGIYDGFDVEIHTLRHFSMSKGDPTAEFIKEQIVGDAENIYGITGLYPMGMAWPGGDYNEETIETVLANTHVKFARPVSVTHGFKLPEYFMKWEPTCHIAEKNLFDLARQFVEVEATEDMLFYVWGHGYELDFYYLYDDFEELVKMMSEAGDVVCITNAEFYQLFKDEIPSWKE